MTTMNPRSASSSHRTPKELEHIHDEDDLTSNCSDLALSDNEQNKAISMPWTIQRQHHGMNKDLTTATTDEEALVSEESFLDASSSSLTNGKSTQDSQGSLTSGISTAMHLSAISKEATTQFVPEKEHELFFSTAQQLEEYVLSQIGKMDECVLRPPCSLEEFENFELKHPLGERVDKSFSTMNDEKSSSDEYLTQVSIQSEKLSLQDEDLHAQLQLGSLFVANDHNSSNYQMETIDTTTNEIINNSHTLCDATENTSVSCSYEETTSAEYSSVNTEYEEPHKQCLKTEQKIEPTLVDEVEQQSIENVAAFSHQTQEYALSPQPQYVNISTTLQLENISPNFNVATIPKRKLEALKTTTSIDSCNIMTTDSTVPSPTEIQFAVVEMPQASVGIKGPSLIKNGIYNIKQKYRKSDKVLICLIFTCIIVSCILFTAPIPLLAVGGSFLQQSVTPSASTTISDGKAIIYTRFPCFIVGTRDCSNADTGRGIAFRISFPTFSKNSSNNLSQTNPKKPYKTLLSDSCYPKTQQYHTESEYVCYTNKDESKVSLTEPSNNQSSYLTNVGFQLLLFGIIGFISSICIVISLCCICWILIEHKPWLQDNLTVSEQLQMEATEEASRKYKEANLICEKNNDTLPKEKMKTKDKPIGTNNNNKSAATQSKPLIAIPSWTRLLVFFGIYLLVLGLLKTVEYFSEGLQKIEGSLDLKSMGYSSDPPEIEVFELIEKMGSEGRTSHLIMQFIDQFLFVPIYCIVHCYIWLKIGEGLFSPLMFVLIALNALVDTAENMSIIVLLLTYPFMNGVVNIKEMAESTQPLSSFPTSQRIVKGLARGLHYFTPYKFMLIGLFFLTMLVMTILSHFMAQASEEEQANSTLGNNNQETTTSASTTTSATTLKITHTFTDTKKKKKKMQ